ncbi:uncharacterized protein LOC131588697 [Poecile atricapillus]|uniref:uncharacterized protein LOC131588697 n=1 Tax=Poecile atricapillus TaxID=48891 RepID=UPI00273845E0|nr:uncharacterized protein LOC131588697 [Poecile atricapillus]
MGGAGLGGFAPHPRQHRPQHVPSGHGWGRGTRGMPVVPWPCRCRGHACWALCQRGGCAVSAPVPRPRVSAPWPCRVSAMATPVGAMMARCRGRAGAVAVPVPWPCHVVAVPVPWPCHVVAVPVPCPHPGPPSPAAPRTPPPTLYSPHPPRAPPGPSPRLRLASPSHVQHPASVPGGHTGAPHPCATSPGPPPPRVPRPRAPRPPPQAHTSWLPELPLPAGVEPGRHLAQHSPGTARLGVPHTRGPPLCRMPGGPRPASLNVGARAGGAAEPP